MSFLFIENAEKPVRGLEQVFFLWKQEYQVFDCRHGNFRIALRYLRGEIKY